MSSETSKYIPAVMLGAGVASMLLILAFILFNESQPSSPNTYLNMYEDYKSYSSDYADRLYDRVGDVTSAVDSYQRTTDYRITQLENQLDALRKQMTSQITINNKNSQGLSPAMECTGERLDIQ